MTQRRPPAPLVLLLAAALLIGLVWTFVVPPFQAPDEPAHVIRAHALDRLGNAPVLAHDAAGEAGDLDTMVVDAARLLRQAHGWALDPHVTRL